MILPICHMEYSLGFAAHLVCVTKPAILLVVIVIDWVLLIIQFITVLQMITTIAWMVSVNVCTLAIVLIGPMQVPV